MLMKICLIDFVNYVLKKESEKCLLKNFHTNWFNNIWKFLVKNYITRIGIMRKIY